MIYQSQLFSGSILISLLRKVVRFLYLSDLSGTDSNLANESLR